MVVIGLHLTVQPVTSIVRSSASLTGEPIQHLPFFGPEVLVHSTGMEKLTAAASPLLSFQFQKQAMFIKASMRMITWNYNKAAAL
jgi:hypothetical protein